MSDIVERLISFAKGAGIKGHPAGYLTRDAACEITRLRAENERLRKALRIATVRFESLSRMTDAVVANFAILAAKGARAALAEPDGEG